MPERLTVDRIERLQAGSVLWDSEVRGLGIRRQRVRGWARYVLRYDFRGRRRWITIGIAGAPWTPETARKRARYLLGILADDKDPAAARDATRGRPTVAQFLKRYLTDHAEPHCAPATAAGYRNIAERAILPKLGRIRIDALTLSDVSQWHAVMKATPFEANRALALLSSLYTIAGRWGVVPVGTNPCKGVPRFRERKRGRLLSEAELAAVGDALLRLETKGLPDPNKPDEEREYVRPSPRASGALRLLILSGARPDEIKTLKWAYLDAKRGIANLPESKTGPKVLRFNSAALVVIEAQPRLKSNPYVFPARGQLGRDGQPIANLSDAWYRVRAAAGLEDVRLYDLRHSFAATAAGANYSLRIIGGLLGHTQPSTTQRYAHLSDDPLRAAAEDVGRRIEGALSWKKKT